MGVTFYGVLGVGPDADADAIRRAYRERVKDHHPDVSDAPDAESRFKRLTTAKETLVDDKERARYDRLGHENYVSQHLGSSAWSESATRSTDLGGGTETGAGTTHGSENGSTGAAASKRGRKDDGQSSDSSTATESTGRGAATEPSSGSATSSKSTSESGASSKSRASESGTSSESSRATAESASRGTTTDSTSGVRSEQSQTHGEGSDRTGVDGQTAGKQGQTRESSGSTRDVGSSAGGTTATATQGSYAHSSFWRSQEPGDRYAEERNADLLVERAWSGLRKLGPWILVHAVFLALAVGTAWYVATQVVADPASSLPLLFVLVGEICLAVVLSTLHVLSTLYR